MPKREVKLDRRFDWVGPPDADSRIRPIKMKQVAGETEIERKYRLEREALNQWNSKFWAEHNQCFEKSKADFIDEHKKKHGILGQITPNEMSNFYRQFLTEHKLSLASYNTEWYRRNARLIWPAMKVQLIRLARLFKR